MHTCPTVCVEWWVGWTNVSRAQLYHSQPSASVQSAQTHSQLCICECEQCALSCELCHCVHMTKEQ